MWSSSVNGPVGPMDKASAHGAGDCRFESCRGQLHWKISQEEAVPNPRRALKLLPGQARVSCGKSGPMRARTADLTVISRTL